MAVIQDVEYKRKKWLKYLIYTVLSIGLIVQFLPLTYLFLSTFKSESEIMAAVPTILPKTWSLENYKTLFEKYDLWKNIGNTVFMCVTIIVIQTITSTLAAYSLSKVRPKCGNFLYMLILGTQMISAMALLFPTYIMFVKMGMIGNKMSWILTSSAWGYAIVLYKSFFDSIPKDLMEAAKIDGAGTFQIILRVIFPLAKPVYTVCILNTFMAVYNDFLFATMLLPDPKDWTLMMRIFALEKTGGAGGALYAAMFISCIPTIIIYLFAQKYIQEGISTSGIKG